MVKRTDTIEFNFHVGSDLYSQLTVLQDAGLSLSAIARLAILKCHARPLDDDCDITYPKRLLIYLHADEVRLLDELAAQEGKRSRAKTLRRIIATYFRINAAAIKALF